MICPDLGYREREHHRSKYSVYNNISIRMREKLKSINVYNHSLQSKCLEADIVLCRNTKSPEYCNKKAVAIADTPKGCTLSMSLSWVWYHMSSRLSLCQGWNRVSQIFPARSKLWMVYHGNFNLTQAAKIFRLVFPYIIWFWRRAQHNLPNDYLYDAFNYAFSMSRKTAATKLSEILSVVTCSTSLYTWWGA